MLELAKSTSIPKRQSKNLKTANWQKNKSEKIKNFAEKGSKLNTQLDDVKLSELSNRTAEAERFRNSRNKLQNVWSVICGLVNLKYWNNYTYLRNLSITVWPQRGIEFVL
jgi:hypothetical protein